MQIWNTVKTTLLLAGLTGLFVVIGGTLGGQTGMLFAFGLAIVMNMGAWWFSDRIALKMGYVSIAVENQIKRWGLSTRASAAKRPAAEWNAEAARKSRRSVRLTRSSKLVVRR